MLLRELTMCEALCFNTVSRPAHAKVPPCSSTGTSWYFCHETAAFRKGNFPKVIKIGSG